MGLQGLLLFAVGCSSLPLEYIRVARLGKQWLIDFFFRPLVAESDCSYHVGLDRAGLLVIGSGPLLHTFQSLIKVRILISAPFEGMSSF